MTGMTNDQKDQTSEPAYTAEERRIVESDERAANEVRMAEEPIDDRLRRAFMNGFREGVEMASWRRGQWDFV